MLPYSYVLFFFNDINGTNHDVSAFQRKLDTEKLIHSEDLFLTDGANYSWAIDEGV